MNESVFKSILGQALECELAELENMPEHKFSLKHRLAMKRIFLRYERDLRRQKKEAAATPISDYKPCAKYGIKKCFVLVTLIIILMTFSVGWAVVFVSEKFSGTVYQSNTHLTAIDLENCPQTIEYKYELAAVPEGFEITETDSYLTEVYTVYDNKLTGQTIVLQQSVKTGYVGRLNTEHHLLEEVDINGKTGLCIDFSENTYSYSFVVWDNGDYIVAISADLDKDSTIKLANINKI